MKANVRACIALVGAWLSLLVVATSHAAHVGDTGLEDQQPGGVVNVYTARHYDTDDELFERFTELTGIRVNRIEGSSDTLLARIQQEGEFSPADVFITVDAGRLYRGEERGIFQPVESALLSERIPATLRHPDGLWFGLTKRARVIIASIDRVDPDVTLSYADLAQPEWRGRVLIRSSNNIYNQSLVSSMIEKHGASETERWCRGLVGNLARRPQGGDRDQIRALAAGEADVAVVNHYYYAQMLAGSPSDRRAAAQGRVIFPDQEGAGTHVNISGAGVVRTAPNRNNAVRLLEFLASDEAQQILVSSTFEYPVVESVRKAPLLVRFGAFRAESINAARLGANNPEAVRVMDRAGWR